MKDAWKFCTMEDGALFATILLATQKPASFAITWASGNTFIQNHKNKKKV